MKRIACQVLFIFCVIRLCSQSFSCDNTIYGMSGFNQLISVEINSTGALVTRPSFLLDRNIFGIGFNPKDNYIYGMDDSNTIVRIDNTGNVTTFLTVPGFDLTVYAVDITPDGNAMVGFGEKNDLTFFFEIELQTGEVQTINLGSNLRLVDIVADRDGGYFGFDAINNSMISLNSNLVMKTFEPIEQGSSVTGLYLSVKGEVMGIGTAIGGLANALFKFDKNTGNAERLTTGSPGVINDLASCPYTLEIIDESSISESFPCNDFLYRIGIFNNTGKSLSGLRLVKYLPEGFDYIRTVEKNIGGELTYENDTIILENATIPTGRSFMNIEVGVGDVAAGNYNSQTFITQTPASLGAEFISDDPRSISWYDPTGVRIVSFEEDSIRDSRLMCQGDVLTLSAEGYGEVIWDNGSVAMEREIKEDGLYFFTAGGDCNSVVVEYEVTFASCPFTFDLGLSIEPDSVFSCSEIIFNYIIKNESGKDRDFIGLVDTLPPGFKVLNFLKKPFNGDVLDEGERVVKIENMFCPLGIDTIQVLVGVGNVEVKTYGLRAKLFNIPGPLGQYRFSDNPNTIFIDSTFLHILGSDRDTTFVKVPLCLEKGATLDASEYGTSFLWFDDSVDSTFHTFESGDYAVRVRSGCNYIWVIFQVEKAPQIAFDKQEVDMELLIGDNLYLPKFSLENETDTLDLFIEYKGDTIEVVGKELQKRLELIENETIPLVGYNGFCTDELLLNVTIDNNVVVSGPNIMKSGETFSLYSPFNISIQQFYVYDRWGGIVYKSEFQIANESFSGWRGKINEVELPEGIYIWVATCLLPDSTSKVFSGDVLVIP